jgi:hypothetical protein
VLPTSEGPGGTFIFWGAQVSSMSRPVSSQTQLVLKALLVGLVGNATMVAVFSAIARTWPRLYIHNGLSFNGNAFMWLFLLFMALFPVVVGGVAGGKTKLPVVGYSVVAGAALGALLIALTYDLPYGTASLIFCASGSLLTAMRPPAAKRVTLPHALYFAGVGALMGIYNLLIIAYFQDVWAYIFFILTHTLSIILCGAKVRNWIWAFHAGWTASSLVFLQWYDPLFVWYNVLVPLLVIALAYIYMYAIWKKWGKQVRGET